MPDNDRFESERDSRADGVGLDTQSEDQGWFGGMYREWLVILGAVILGAVLLGGLYGASQVHHNYLNEQLAIVFTTIATTLLPIVLSELLRRRKGKMHRGLGRFLAGFVFLLPALTLFSCVAFFAVWFGVV